MTKAELVANLATSLDMPKAQVRRVIDAMVDSIVDTVKSGEKVSISGLGTIELRKRAAREGRNPQTGAKITIGARNAVGFKVAQPFKSAVQ